MRSSAELHNLVIVVMLGDRQVLAVKPDGDDAAMCHIGSPNETSRRRSALFDRLKLGAVRDLAFGLPHDGGGIGLLRLSVGRPAHWASGGLARVKIEMNELQVRSATPLQLHATPLQFCTPLRCNFAAPLRCNFVSPHTKFINASADSSRDANAAERGTGPFTVMPW